MGFLDTANQKLAELQQRTGDFMTVQKLNSQRRTLKRDLERMYTVIGETCCRMHAEGGDPEALNAMFTEVEVLKEKISALDIQADALNRVTRCPGCGESISKDLNFCPRCGRRLIVVQAQPTEEPEPTDTVTEEETKEI